MSTSIPFFFSPNTLERPVIPGDMNGSVTHHTQHQIANQIPHWCEMEITQKTSFFFFFPFMSRCDWRWGKKSDKSHLTTDNWKLLIELCRCQMSPNIDYISNDGVDTHACAHAFAIK